MPPSVAGSACSVVERTGTRLEAIRSKIPNPNGSKSERVEAKYDVVLDYPNLELHSAAASGNVGLVLYALTHGQPVNSLLHGCLPLHAASSGGNITVVRMLVERGADVNAPRLPRRYSDHKRGSNTPAVGTAGSTPLHFAAANGHATIVQFLLACGAVADKPDKNGMTPEDLAELSGHTQVVHSIRVWQQMNEAQSPTTTGSDAGDHEGQTRRAGVVSKSRRPRSHSVTSSALTESDTGESLSALHPGANGSASSNPSGLSRKGGKERAQIVVAAASEKGRNLFRNSIENGFRAPIKNALKSHSHPQPPPVPALPPPASTPSQPPSTPYRTEAPPSTPKLTITTSTPPQENGSASHNLDNSPFHESPTSTERSDSFAHLSGHHEMSPISSDPYDSEQHGYRQMSSQRPSLPSIVERAANSAPLRLERRPTTGDSSPASSITEPLSTSPLSTILSTTSTTSTTTTNGNAAAFFRGRGRHLDRRINKQAILGLFRRGMSPHSRSPSPPRKTEPTAPIDCDTVDANVARLKRASMDPELMRMALDVDELREQLEASATISAPVTKTRFFDDSQYNSSTTSLSSGSTPLERPWERRKGSGVISPSPLARGWSGNDDEPIVPQGAIRRTRTEVRKVSSTQNRPRRMPSEPHLAAAAAARRRSMAGMSFRAVSDPANTSPSTAATTPADSPLRFPSDAEAADDEREDAQSITPDITPSTDNLADGIGTVDGVESAAPVAGVESAAPVADVPSLTLDAPGGGGGGGSERSWATESHESGINAGPQGRFRGESIGSATTVSTRGLRTPPSSQITPPGSGSVRCASAEDVSLGMNSTSPKRSRGTRSRGHSEASMASTLGSGFPPVPEHETAEVETRPYPTVRRISTHAEARDAMQKTEQDVLALAQLPMTANSSRSLADQLAAYGDSHAMAEELARAERVSSFSSGSERNSVTSSDSAAVRRRPTSSLSSARPTRLGTSPSHQYSGSVPSISEIYQHKPIADIYERREKAHRERLQALTSSTPIYSMRSTVQRSRSVSGEYRPRPSSSDNWLTAGPNAALGVRPPQRRLTEPSSEPEQTDSHPHISGPLPMVTEPPRLNQKARTRSTLGMRPQVPSSLKHHNSSASSAASASMPGSHSSSHLRSNSHSSGSSHTANGVPTVPAARGMMRSTSLHRPNDKVNSMRYQGLTQARQFAAGAGQISRTGGQQVRTSSELDSDSDERTRAFAALTDDWRPSHYSPLVDRTERSGKWGQLKGVLGNLRKS